MNNKRVFVLLFCFFIVISGLIYRASVLMVGNENSEKANLVLMNRSPVSLQHLNEHAGKLEEMTNDINNYTFSSIKREIDKTIKLINLTNLELKAQYEAWISVKGMMKSDSDSLIKLKDQLDTTRNLQQKEILKLKKILDEVQKPSLITDLFNLALTFVLGVLSSILATMGLTLWRNRSTKTT
ncbi:hypothetical protein SAMN05216302_105015 [Nitrosomonas aestuarii]|uniref:Four helix bundle sensory module for signal transduction n=1 Tax=Nitrosomonas aestuarii TaxID=52441 RepID=A0A1I4GBC9_9PROT|nr:hypothetical protein [Nitrosomonas aestuarii]SFL26820.1 hypothetical protein SAMN05216302_105015 [Nitrosomonas aestuarii]